MSSSKLRNRSRSPAKRPNDRSHHHSEDRNDRRSSREKSARGSPQSRHEETPKSDSKPVAVKNEHSDSRDVSNSNETTPKSNSTSRHYVNPVTGKMERKFSNRCRLFVGNIGDITEEEFKKMFEKYGEFSEAYVNKEKAFGFVKMDTRMNAEAAKNALDGSTRRGRMLTVRFASISAAIHVSNLGPLVSNEMLEKAFSTFGDVERAVVVVDDRGRSKGYGVVEFARKGSAINAIQKTNDNFFMIGRSPRPVFTKQQEQTNEEEGLAEKSIERLQGYFNERDAGARFATPGTFEFDWCQKWKALDEVQRSKKEILEKEFLESSEKLEGDMVQAVIDYENELRRRELLAKQEELLRQEEMMRQELLRQQAIEMRRHEEARIQEELRRQEELRMQEEMMIRRQHEELLHRRQHEETAFYHGGRMPHVPPFGVSPGVVQPGFIGGHALSPLPALPHRVPLGPMSAKGLPHVNDPRHPVMAYELDGERAREQRALDRADRARISSRYHDHPSRDRYGDSRKR